MTSGVGEGIFNAAADVVDDVAGQYVVNQCENSGGLLDHLANDVMNTYKDVSLLINMYV